MPTFFLALLGLVLAGGPAARAQQPEAVPDAITKQAWEARWISHPEISGQEYGVAYFRKSLDLAGKPGKYIVYVSGDNCYKLYVNGHYISQGPATGDLMKWHYERYDLAPYLKAGRNTVAALVWNFAGHRPVFEASHETGFILQGEGPEASALNTDASWKVFRDEGYAPLPFKTRHYYVVGPGEEVQGAHHPWNWQQPDFDDSNWVQATAGEQGRTLHSLEHYGHPPSRILYPRQLPLMEETPQRFKAVWRSEGIQVPDGFLSGAVSLHVPPRSKVSLLLDQGHLTNAYPVLAYSGGKGGRIQLTYAEALMDAEGVKGNRDEIEGKSNTGNQDIIHPDGGDSHSYQTLWWRTFRYVRLDLETADTALRIDDLSCLFTGYPFEVKASFSSNDSLTQKILEVGWRTQRLCAGETFFDCPYYEQLQYVGDTRIQSLVSTYVSGDSTLFRNALRSLQDSRLPLGLTHSRYPSREVQLIPPFSLIWVNMLWDYWQLFDDPELIRDALPAVLEVLSWYEEQEDGSGMLGPMEWRNFMDGVTHENWTSGAPPGVRDGRSAILNLHFVYTLQKAIPLLECFGFEEEARRYGLLADGIRNQVYAACYDPGKGLLADVPEKDTYSQHANILGILTNCIPHGRSASRYGPYPERQ